MAHDGFISHAHQNRNIAEAVCAKLEGAGIPCWTAPRDIKPGHQWSGAIVGAIAESKVLLLIKYDQIRRPGRWIMLLDTDLATMYSPVRWERTEDFDGDTIADSNLELLQGGLPYNGGEPRVHRDTINIATCDGHVERMGYDVFLNVNNGYWRDED